MNLINKSTLEIKKSKFIAYFYEIEKVEEVNIILDELKKEHKRARHIPYAYIFKQTAKKTDDKEPSGTAGLPIYNVLEREKLNTHLIAVVRYFGGKKLGASNLLRAYSKASRDVINNLY